jgi:hypothetical protein
MPESTLTIDYDALRQEVGFYLGYSTTIASWSASKSAIIESIVQAGYRRVLYPPAMQGVPAGYEWSFLRPTTTLAITSDDGDYDLPIDYGRIVGEFHYAPDIHRASIQMTSLANLLEMRSASDMNAAPVWSATRYKSSDGTAGQLQEVLFYPEPDASYTLYYSYDAYAGALTATIKYPLGGMQMSEVYKESCLAVAENRNGDEIGLHSNLFQSLMIDAVARDRKRGAQNFGQMGRQDSLEDINLWRRGMALYEGAYDITYKGSQV